MKCDKHLWYYYSWKKLRLNFIFCQKLTKKKKKIANSQGFFQIQNQILEIRIGLELRACCLIINSRSPAHEVKALKKKDKIENKEKKAESSDQAERIKAKNGHFIIIMLHFLIITISRDY